jgi:hypothetical protein
MFRIRLSQSWIVCWSLVIVVPVDLGMTARAAGLLLLAAAGPDAGAADLLTGAGVLRGATDVLLVAGVEEFNDAKKSSKLRPLLSTLCVLVAAAGVLLDAVGMRAGAGVTAGLLLGAADLLLETVVGVVFESGGEANHAAKLTPN